MTDTQPSNVVETAPRFSATRIAAERAAREQRFRHDEEREENEFRLMQVRVVGVFLLVLAAVGLLIGLVALTGAS